MTSITKGFAKEESSDLDKEDKELTKEEHAVNFAKALAEIDRALEPFREHKHDLKEMYKSNGWMTKDEMTQVAKAYRMLKSGDDISKIWDYIDMLRKNPSIKIPS